MKSVQLQPSVESTLTSGKSSTGLLLGSSWDTRAYVVAAIPTPPLPKQSDWTASEWFLEHARQVKRMLVGGVELIGCYVGQSAEQEASLRELIYDLPITAPAVDRYFIKVSPKLTCEYFTGTKKEALKSKPVSQFKVQDFSSSLVSFTTTLNLDLTFPVAFSGQGVPFKQQILNAMDLYKEKIFQAAVSIDGVFAQDQSLTIEKAFESGSSKGKKGKAKKAAKSESDDSSTHEVEFFYKAPIMQQVNKVEGQLRLRGTCFSRTYAHNKYTIAQALESLRYDIFNSFSSRLQLLAEDSEASNVARFDLPTGGLQSFAWNLPRRLFQPLSNSNSNSGDVCDYLLGYEKEADGVSRMEELLSTKDFSNLGTPYTLESCEISEIKEETPLDAANAPAILITTTNKKVEEVPDNNLLMFGLLVVGLAVTVGYFGYM